MSQPRLRFSFCFHFTLVVVKMKLFLERSTTFLVFCCPCPSSLETCRCHQIQNEHIFANPVNTELITLCFMYVVHSIPTPLLWLICVSGVFLFQQSWNISEMQSVRAVKSHRTFGRQIFQDDGSSEHYHMSTC